MQFSANGLALEPAGDDGPDVHARCHVERPAEKLRLGKIPLGVLAYMDEGRDARYSGEIIKAAAEKAGRVIVLRPGSAVNQIYVRRRGQRKYQLVIEGKPRRLGKSTRKTEPLLWATKQIQAISALTSRKERIANGCGLSQVEINRMIKQFKNAGKMAKKLSSKNGMKDLQAMMGQMGGAGALRR